METDSAVLDFSTKKSQGGGKAVPARDDGDADSALNLIKPTIPVLPAESLLNGPLDLSVPSRKRGIEDSPSASLPVTALSPSPHAPSRKNSRLSSEFKPSVVSPWTSPVVASHFPYFAAAVAASLSPKNNSTNANHGTGETPLWNGKIKMHEKQASHFGGVPTPSDATKALEKMSELSKLGGDDMFRPSVNSGVPGNGGNTSGRHSAWQSHWLNKGADQAKDVLKCVWCKQSFPSLAAMTAHMKEAKHCGVNVPAPPIQPPPPPPPQQPPTSAPSVTSNTSGSNVGPPTSATNKPTTADLNLLIKETMPLPRKLVRGQDVWLGKGAEQTRQILKCMWCGQSFRSLAEMTSHMQQTQHYTNIISQEQIISWKSSDDAKTGGGPGGGAASGGAGGASSHVSAVLTCKVCDQAFSSLKELSNHMVKNSHYKEHIMRSITESGGRRRQTREKRKKSLPVRKLLELERAQHELKNGEGGMIIGGKVVRDAAPTAGRITCEKCGEKIETSIFVEHIRQCVGGGSIGSNQRNLLKNALLSNNALPSDVPVVMGQTIADRDSRKSLGEESAPSTVRQHRSPSLATDLSSGSKEAGTGGPLAGGDTSSPSVLNAIEKLIEKSFDSRARHGGTTYGSGPGGVGTAPMGSSILKRLGIDESVDYTKPLVDAQTMNILRNYHHHHHNQQHHYNRRERSGSESSSVSDRGGGGCGRTESLTPDRKSDIAAAERLLSSTPRATPEKRIQTPPSAKIPSRDESVDGDVIKKEVIMEEEREESRKSTRREAILKKEEVEDGDDDEDDKGSFHSNGRQRRVPAEEVPLTPASGGEDGEEVTDRRSSNSIPSPVLSPRQTTPLTPSGTENVAAVPSSPCRNSTSSPASSDRSGTPRSTAGTDKKSSAASGTSLGALSSMFDSLSGASGGGDTVSSAGRSSSHPLAALQKLCDKTERHGGTSNRSCASAGTVVSGNHSASSGVASSQSGTGGGGGTAPGAILAFSWACNDAVMTADSIMKCAFCDTPFISKGAYRHHLSKMHFVKDGVIPDPVALKAQQQQQPSGSASGSSSNAGKVTGIGNSSSVSAASNTVSGASGSSSGKSPQQQANFEESPHSKFLKYTELAKQLSSKYV